MTSVTTAKITIEHPIGMRVWDTFNYLRQLEKWITGKSGAKGYEPFYTYRWIFPDGVELTMPEPTNKEGTRFVFRQGSAQELTEITMDEVEIEA